MPIPNQTRRKMLGGLAGLTTLPAVHSSVRAASVDRIRVGQIGVGHAHATKLSVYRESDDYEVVGIAEPDAGLRENMKGQAAFRDLPWMSQEELLNASGLQVVLVETEVRDSLDVALECISAGVHVHLDKPAGESLPKFKQILAEAERRKLLVQLGYMYRYNPAILLLRQFLENGWLGDVFEIHTVMSKVVPPQNRLKLAEYKGGILFELGCHILDLVIGILGEPQRIESFHRHSSPSRDQLVDNSLAVFEFPNAIASVKSTALEVEGFARRHFVLCGTKGTFHIQPLDNPKAQIALDAPQGKFEKGYQDVSFPRFRRYVADAKDMAEIIRGNKASDFSYAHDLAVQRTLLQACRLSLD